ncbi:MAG: tRNA-dihydrouridine synthase, partial [Gammaproteobacteria bacterium]|nr:tRNA-dihydrouridine synthase [Gammaproteobacteria bacterium]
YLQGLSPKENRSVPPLRYGTVTRLKRDFPELDIVINGGINDLSVATELFGQVDGLMIGRQACAQPYFLAELQAKFIDESDAQAAPQRAEVVRQMTVYAARECARGARLHQITRHMLGLYAGQPGAARWRRFLSEHAVRPGAKPELLTEALSFLPAAA